MPIITSWLIFSPMALLAQSMPVPPSVLHQPHYYDRQHNSLLRLEKPPVKIFRRTVNLDDYTWNYEVEGAKSPVRLEISDSGSFVVLLRENDEELPTAYAILYKTIPKKGNRVVIYREIRNEIVHEFGAIPMNIKKIGPNYYELTPMIKLGKGEYMFVYSHPDARSRIGAAEAFAFGID